MNHSSRFGYLIIATIISLIAFTVFALRSYLGRGVPDARRTVDLSLDRQSLQITTKVKGDVHWQRDIHEIRGPVRHLEIQEVFYNETSSLVGVKVDISVSADFTKTWLGGQKLSALDTLSLRKSPVDFSDPWNPTVYTGVSMQSGVGLVAEDDVFRQQVRLFYDPLEKKAGLRTESMCIAPHSKIKFVWSAYPAGGSYWDFINDLRLAWGVNHVIEGSTIWFLPDDILAMDINYLKSRLSLQGVKTASMFGGWTDPQLKPSAHQPPPIGFGTAVLDPRFAGLRSRLKLAILKLKQALPAIDVLIYFDAQRDSSIGAAKTFADSLVKDINSQTEQTDWQGQFSQTWSVYPTLENHFGSQLKGSVLLARSLGADGVYWDEMDSLDYSGVRFTTSAWDGHSCLLDHRNQILQKIGYTNLLSSEAKIEYARMAGLVLANSPPTTRVFNERPDTHMVEGQHRSDYSSYIHLSTPLAFIGTDVAWSQIIAPLEKGLLPAAVRLDYNTPFFAHIFPIEVIEISPGAVFGREKIIASHSGLYGWQTDCNNVEILHFDDHGQMSGARQGDRDPTRPCLINARLAPQEVIVISRTSPRQSTAPKTPVFFRPAFH